MRDVAYRLYADMDLVGEDARANPAKYVSMFNRRATAGQCVNQPYLGCREFAARFRLVPLDERGRPGADEPPCLEGWNENLGWMLHDLDYSHPTGPQPQFFKAQVQHGAMDISSAEVRG